MTDGENMQWSDKYQVFTQGIGIFFLRLDELVGIDRDLFSKAETKWIISTL